MNEGIEQPIDEYLSESEEENYGSLDGGNVNGSPEQCNDTELIFNGKEEMGKFIEQLKNKIHNAIFQIGSTEEVHDPSILSKYKTFLKVIYDMLIKFMDNPSMQLNMDISENIDIQTSFQSIIQYLREYMDNDPQTTENDYRRAFLKLHLICYPYCQRENCLSMD